MKLRLFELQNNNEEANAFRSNAKFLKGWKDVEGVLQYQGLLYVPELICSKVISCYHNDPPAKHFDIDKTRELVDQKYYWPSVRKDVENYVSECNICLAFKVVCHKLYDDLQSLFVPTH